MRSAPIRAAVRRARRARGLWSASAFLAPAGPAAAITAAEDPSWPSGMTTLPDDQSCCCSCGLGLPGGVGAELSPAQTPGSAWRLFAAARYPQSGPALVQTEADPPPAESGRGLPARTALPAPIAVAWPLAGFTPPRPRRLARPALAGVLAVGTKPIQKGFRTGWWAPLRGIAGRPPSWRFCDPGARRPARITCCRPEVGRPARGLLCGWGPSCSSGLVFPQSRATWPTGYARADCSC